MGLQMDLSTVLSSGLAKDKMKASEMDLSMVFSLVLAKGEMKEI